MRVPRNWRRKNTAGFRACFSGHFLVAQLHRAMSLFAKLHFAVWRGFYNRSMLNPPPISMTAPVE